MRKKYLSLQMRLVLFDEEIVRTSGENNLEWDENEVPETDA